MGIRENMTLSVNRNLALIAFDRTSQDLHQGGFARTVITNKTDDFAGSQRQINIY
jgi:hypothetical protein